MGLLSAKAVGLGLLTHQALGMVAMRRESRGKYAVARQVADDLGKPLLVVGGPYGSAISGRLFGMKAHGPGDV